MVDICGRAMPLIISEEYMIEGGAVASCSCTQGSCEVKRKEMPVIGSITWCTGVCTGTCSLSTSMTMEGEATYSAVSYNF